MIMCMLILLKKKERRKVRGFSQVLNPAKFTLSSLVLTGTQSCEVHFKFVGSCRFSISRSSLISSRDLVGSRSREVNLQDEYKYRAPVLFCLISSVIFSLLLNLAISGDKSSRSSDPFFTSLHLLFRSFSR